MKEYTELQTRIHGVPAVVQAAQVFALFCMVFSTFIFCCFFFPFLVFLSFPLLCFVFSSWLVRVFPSFALCVFVCFVGVVLCCAGLFIFSPAYIRLYVFTLFAYQQLSPATSTLMI